MCTRYPFLACEIFCCEVDSIFATIIENQDLLEKLFKFLDKPSSSPTTTTDADDSAAAMESSAASTDAVAKSPPRKLNILLAGYFSRVAGCFILRYMPEFMQFLKGNLGIIDSLIAKIDNTSIAEVLMRLVGADEQTITYHAECVQWLDETTLLPQLLARVSNYGASQYSDREAINASEVLVAISRTAPSSLSSSLSSPSSVQTLLNAVNCEGSVCLTSALTVILSVLDPRRSCTAMQNAGPMSHSVLPSPPGMAGQQQQQQQRQATLVMLEAIEDLFVGLIGKLVSLLDVADNTDDGLKVMEMSYGSLRPPFGQMRLRIVEVLSMLFRTGGDKSFAALIEADAISVLMRLFRRYPFNNFLHSEVEYILCSILDMNNATLVAHLMNDVRILAVLAELPTSVESRKTGSEKTISWAAGYNGHVTRICNEILNVAGENPVVAKAAEECSPWRSFVADVLSVRNTTEDVQKWNCGRPARLEDNYIESDDDDMQQLNFDTLNNSVVVGNSSGSGVDDDASNKAGGGIGGLAGVLQGRYDSYDDDGTNADDAELSQMLDDIDNDDDDVYFAQNSGGGVNGDGGDGGGVGSGGTGGSGEGGSGSFDIAAGQFTPTFTQFAFHDDAAGDADDDVVVVEGDDVVADTHIGMDKEKDAVGLSSSTPSGGSSYMETLVRGMQATSLGGSSSGEGGGGSGGGGDSRKEADGSEEKEAAEFNTFQYWKRTYEVEIPEDA